MDMSKIDLMINDSLIILYNSQYGAYVNNLVDENGIEMNRYNGEHLASLMQQKGLITITGQRCDLTYDGAKIVENGGYLKFRDEQKGSIKSEQITNNLHVHGDNYGILNQGSRLENSPINTKIRTAKTNPQETPIRKKPNSLLVALNKIWKFINSNIIAFFVILLIAYIIKQFGYKFISH